MEDFNDIGIKRELDWNRIRKLLAIGLFSSLLVFVSDMLLGWGIQDETKTGIIRILYVSASEGELFFSSLSGLFGITLEGLSFFGIYRLIVPYSGHYAHLYRTGIFGWMMFGACGFHVPVCALGFLLRRGVGEEAVRSSALYFVLPSLILFALSFVILSWAQIASFIKGYTPYPRWCWIFSLPVMMIVVMLLNLLGNREWVNAVTYSWISLSGIWMFSGLLLMMKRAEREEKRS